MMSELVVGTGVSPGYELTMSHQDLRWPSLGTPSPASFLGVGGACCHGYHVIQLTSKGTVNSI